MPVIYRRKINKSQLQALPMVPSRTTMRRHGQRASLKTRPFRPTALEESRIGRNPPPKSLMRRKKVHWDLGEERSGVGMVGPQRIRSPHPQSKPSPKGPQFPD